MTANEQDDRSPRGTLRDHGGRFAGKFHGIRFDPLNLVLYINGLTNSVRKPTARPEPGWWERLKALFR